MEARCRAQERTIRAFRMGKLFFVIKVIFIRHYAQGKEWLYARTKTRTRPRARLRTGRAGPSRRAVGPGISQGASASRASQASQAV